MKTLVALALTFFLTTFGFVVGHNVVHHEDEPNVVLPGGPTVTKPTVASSTVPTTTIATTDLSTTAEPASTSPSTTAAPSSKAEVPRTIGSTATATVANGRHESRALENILGDGSGTSDPRSRALGAKATTSAPAGRSSWFAALGSDFALTPGNGDGKSAVVRIDGLTWRGTLTTDSESAQASITIRLEARDDLGNLLGTTEVTTATRSTPGSSSLDSGDPRDASVPITLPTETEPTTVHAYLYVETAVQGGSGATTSDFLPSSGKKGNGVRFTSFTMTVGAAIATPTTVTAPVVPGAGITAPQLAEHATADSCWLLIEGRVYDMTPYLRRHPGSQLPVLKVCGKEATEAFLTQGGRGSRHSYEAIDKMATLYIGDYAG